MQPGGELARWVNPIAAWYQIATRSVDARIGRTLASDRKAAQPVLAGLGPDR
jgi:hypothetical protein